MSRRTVKLLGIGAGRGARLPGAEDGPLRLRQMGLVESLTRIGCAVDDLGDVPGVHETRFAKGSTQVVNNLPNVLQVNRHTHACVLGTRRKSPGAFLLVIGGDHSLAVGTLAGLSDGCERLGLLWVDAHADFNTPVSSPSGNVHGMSLAIACGRGHLDLRLICDYDPMVEEQDVFLLGPRDVDSGEMDNLLHSKVNFLSTSQWRAAGIVETATRACEALRQRCDHIHLSFDIDVLDPAAVAGTGTPVPEGLRPEEAVELLRALGRQGYVGSAEFVEYNPNLDPDEQTGRRVIALIEALLTA